MSVRLAYLPALVLIGLVLEGAHAQTSSVSDVLYYNYPLQVCYNSFTENEARVACQDLGYFNATSTFAQVPCPSSSFYLMRLSCSGSEETLGSCAQTPMGDCTPALCVSVTCSSEISPSDRVRSTTTSSRSTTTSYVSYGSSSRSTAVLPAGGIAGTVVGVCFFVFIIVYALITRARRQKALKEQQQANIQQIDLQAQAQAAQNNQDADPIPGRELKYNDAQPSLQADQQYQMQQQQPQFIGVIPMGGAYNHAEIPVDNINQPGIQGYNLGQPQQVQAQELVVDMNPPQNPAQPSEQGYHFQEKNPVL